MLGRSLLSRVFSKQFIAIYPAVYRVPYRFSPFSSSTFNVPIFSTYRIMSSKAHNFSSFLIPKGWSNDPDELAEISEGFDKSWYGIEDSRTITALLACESRVNPDALLTCSKGYYYLWNTFNEKMVKIIAPRTLDEIISKLGDPRKEGMKFEKLKGADSVYLEALPFSPSLIPPGWTADPARLNDLTKGFPRSLYGMEDSLTMTAILHDTGRYSGCLGVLLKCSKGDYYVWEMISDSVQRILAPKSLDEIIPRLEVGKLCSEEIEFEELEGVDSVHLQALPFSPSLIPPGWSDDPTELAKISEDFPTELFVNGDSFKMTALLFDTGKISGCPDVLLECSKGNYYLWNQISDNVNRILAPKTLEKIVPELEAENEERLEFEKLESVKHHVEFLPPKWY